MKINNIQGCQKGEVVIVNRKINFQAQPATQRLLKKLEVDMTTRVGYEGPSSFSRAPKNFKNGLGKVFREMGINWNTHIDPDKPKKIYA